MPIAALAPALISTVGGSLLGKALGGPSGAQQNVNNSLQTLATNTGQKGMSFLDQAQTSLGTPQAYFSSLLNGNQGQTAAALAPDVNRIRDATQQNLTTTSTLAPRGGARSSMLFQLPTSANANVQSLYNSARPAAATNLANIGATEGGLGTNLASVSANTNDALAKQLAAQKANQYSVGQSLGSGIFNMAKGIDWSKLKFPGSGGGGGGAPQVPDSVFAQMGGE